MASWLPLVLSPGKGLLLIIININNIFANSKSTIWYNRYWYHAWSFQENVVKNEAEEDEFEKTKPGKGAITSQFYRTTNIPERFNNPGTSSSFLQITKLI